ncbi:hypothetical protein EYC84_007871 [Monilinia fructicola]|uniref:Uncharacterized protein n=1 Tax=Monilinia fructicola TaxID=38448 RepID=A0A5M9JM59_MONFR|nr:hypothetical protein EYC84_007871 [Monilinia fructicola]
MPRHRNIKPDPEANPESQSQTPPIKTESSSDSDPDPQPSRPPPTTLTHRTFQITHTQTTNFTETTHPQAPQIPDTVASLEKQRAELVTDIKALSTLIMELITERDAMERRKNRVNLRLQDLQP